MIIGFKIGRRCVDENCNLIKKSTPESPPAGNNCSFQILKIHQQATSILFMSSQPGTSILLKVFEIDSYYIRKIKPPKFHKI
jgi:hypothetical protein